MYICVCCLHYAAAFFEVHFLFWLGKRIAAQGLYFNEYEHAFFLCHYVELEVACPPVSRQYGIVAEHQIARGSLFASASQVIVFGHVLCFCGVIPARRNFAVRGLAYVLCLSAVLLSGAAGAGCRSALLLAEAAFLVGRGKLVHCFLDDFAGIGHVETHESSPGRAEHLAVIEKKSCVVDVEIHKLFL